MQPNSHSNKNPLADSLQMEIVPKRTATSLTYHRTITQTIPFPTQIPVSTTKVNSFNNLGPNPDFSKKPGRMNPSNLPNPSHNSGPKLCEKYFQGKCDFGNKCRFMHDLTTDKDLVFTFKEALGGEQQIGSDFAVVNIVKIPIEGTAEFIIIFGQLHSIKGMKISIQGNIEPCLLIDFEAHQTISCLKFLSGNLVYGLYDETTGLSDIRFMNVDTKAIVSTISPAHDRHIIGLDLFGNYLISVSRDGKIKFWTFSNETNQFVIFNSHNFDGTPSFFTTSVLMGKPCLMIGFEEGHLEILSIGLDQENKLSIGSLLSQKNLHKKVVTCISVFKDSVLTSSLDNIMSLMTNDGVNNSNLHKPITFFQILRNRRDEDILAIGFDSGVIELRKFSNDLKVYGTIPHTKGARITFIEYLSHRVNDINFSMIIVADSNGEVSL